MLKLPPIGYNLRSLFVRWSSTLLTVVGIGATVAVLAGILALQQGFATLYADAGREDVVVFMRKGATSEGESAFPLDRARVLKVAPEIAIAEDGAPLAAGEIYLAVRRRKLDGGETNVPIRGVEPASLKIRARSLRIIDGRAFEPGTDEVMVGRALTDRIRNCKVDDVILFNTTPFRVAGIFECDGPFGSEVWGDVNRMSEALRRPGGYNTVVAQVRPDTDVDAMAERIAEDEQAPATVMTERAYLASQTEQLTTVLYILGGVLGFVMGIAAVFTGTNTMLAALAARSHEIGVLLSIGFRPFPIFLSFLFEALVLGLLGGIAGCLLVMPLHGVDTGTTNFQTFTEVAFSFRVTPRVLITAIVFAVGLGLMGGLFPALKAALKNPVDALRHK